MADIDLTRFVNININYYESTKLSSGRVMVALFVKSSEASFSENYIELDGKNDNNYSKLSGDAKSYVDIFFSCGGTKLRIQKINSGTSATATDVDSLPYQAIVIASSCGYNLNVENYNSGKKNINKKLILMKSSTPTDSYSNNEGVAVKVYSSDKTGYEMSIAAYLSLININENNSIQDYDFTSEFNLEAEPTNDSILGDVMNKNNNIDMVLAGNTRNIGGNCTNGKDLVGWFSLILMQQTLSERLVDLLSTKIKGIRGLSAIYNTLSNELDKYVDNGLLTTDKIWDKDTQTISKNNKTYTLIEKGTPLSLGYYITILPFSSLTDDEKENHSAPYIYIALATYYGIRKIDIEGAAI